MKAEIDTAAFIYYKSGKFNVLTTDDAMAQHKTLLEQGYKHTATLNLFVYFENLVNLTEKEIIKKIKKLKK